MTLLYTFGNILLADTVWHSGDWPGTGGNKITTGTLTSRYNLEGEQFVCASVGNPALVDIVFSSEMRLGAGPLALSTSISEHAQKEVMSWFANDKGSSCAWFFGLESGNVFQVRSGVEGNGDSVFNNIEWTANAVLRAGSAAGYLEDVRVQSRIVVDKFGLAFDRVHTAICLDEEGADSDMIDLVGDMLQEVVDYAMAHLSVWNQRDNQGVLNNFQLSVDGNTAFLPFNRGAELIAVTSVVEVLGYGRGLVENRLVNVFGNFEQEVVQNFSASRDEGNINLIIDLLKQYY